MSENKLVSACLQMGRRDAKVALERAHSFTFWCCICFQSWMWWWFQECIHVSKFIMLCNLNTCSLLYANYASIKLPYKYLPSKIKCKIKVLLLHRRNHWDLDVHRPLKCRFNSLISTIFQNFDFVFCLLFFVTSEAKARNNHPLPPVRLCL